MHTQFRRGVIEMCVLSLIYEKDRYGYDIVNELSDHIDVTKGTVYPILSRLKKQKLFENYLKESDEGPIRKYYTLTDKGREYTKELIEGWKVVSAGAQAIISRIE
ncbi:MAG: PadR family transcriptional regulator [Candidatus Muiribacteriaceae bacterium]